MSRICVFCGSQAGTNGLYRQAATDLGQLLARRGYGLVYGGGHVGLMGVIADAVLASGGEVTGVIPESIAEGFIRSEHRRLLTIADAPATLLDTLSLSAGRENSRNA